MFTITGVDINQPITIFVTFNITGSSAPTATFSGLTTIYSSAGGAYSEGENSYFLIGQPVSDTVTIDFINSGNVTFGISAAYQAIVQ